MTVAPPAVVVIHQPKPVKPLPNAELKVCMF